MLVRAIVTLTRHMLDECNAIPLGHTSVVNGWCGWPPPVLPSNSFAVALEHRLNQIGICVVGGAQINIQMALHLLAFLQLIVEQSLKHEIIRSLGVHAGKPLPASQM